jgi:short-subunit dehydrogenase
MPGEVLSMQFASLGAKLILSARNKNELERVKYNIVSKFQKLMFSSSTVGDI